MYYSITLIGIVCTHIFSIIHGSQNIENPHALTTPFRYGCRLSSDKFDKIAYEALPKKKPYFSSDHILCTPNILFDPLYEKSFALYQLLSSIYEYYNQHLLPDITNTYIKPLTQQLLLLQRQELYKTRGDRYTYNICCNNAIKKINHCIEHVKSNCFFIYFKPLSSILHKLEDDKKALLQRYPMTEQNLIRALQVNNISDRERLLMLTTTSSSRWPYEYVEIANAPKFFAIKNIHEKIKNMHLTNNIVSSHNMPIFHTKTVFNINTLRCHTLENIAHEPGIYYRFSLLDTLNYIIKKDIYDTMCHENYAYNLTTDPRYNPVVHGPQGVIWFKFPHEADFDATSNGEGSTWIKPEDARLYLLQKNPKEIKKNKLFVPIIAGSIAVIISFYAIVNSCTIL